MIQMESNVEVGSTASVPGTDDSSSNAAKNKLMSLQPAMEKERQQIEIPKLRQVLISVPPTSPAHSRASSMSSSSPVQSMLDVRDTPTTSSIRNDGIIHKLDTSSKFGLDTDESEPANNRGRQLQRGLSPILSVGDISPVTEADFSYVTSEVRGRKVVVVNNKI